MSRVAKKSIPVPKGLKITLSEKEIVVEGAKGVLSLAIHPAVKITYEEGVLIFAPQAPGDIVGSGAKGEAGLAKAARAAWAQAGTQRALVRNALEGVDKGYERKLQLVGVGYKAKAEGGILDLALGLSHPVHYVIPQGIVIETPTQTDIVIKGIKKEQVGEVAAKIRRYREPEPYKGKGIRYDFEKITLKEVKKK